MTTSIASQSPQPGYHRTVFKALQIRADTGEHSERETFLADGCISFWREFQSLSSDTRSCVVYDLMTRLERDIYGYDLPDCLNPSDYRDWDYF